MVAFSSLVLALSAIAGSLASPAVSVKRDGDFGAANFVLPRDSALNPRATVNYDQDYTTGGTVDYSPDGSYFKVTWSDADDFVVGVGWSTGSTS